MIVDGSRSDFQIERREIQKVMILLTNSGKSFLFQITLVKLKFGEILRKHFSSFDLACSIILSEKLKEVGVSEIIHPEIALFNCFLIANYIS